MILLNSKIIFVQIPKNMGSSIEVELLNNYLGLDLRDTNKLFYDYF